MSSRPIRGTSVLPARRTALTLHTADGLSLVGELALPADRDPVATLVCLHPLPTHGGMMDSHVIRKASYRLPALAGLAVLRFNTRGTSSAQGTSEGQFDGGEAERFDIAAAVERAEFDELPDVWLLGWSFGTDLVLRYGLEESVVGAVLLSPPLRSASDDDLDAWAADGRPLVALVPEHDDYLRPDEARRRFGRVPQAEVVGVDGREAPVGRAHRAGAGRGGGPGRARRVDPAAAGLVRPDGDRGLVDVRRSDDRGVCGHARGVTCGTVSARERTTCRARDLTQRRDCQCPGDRRGSCPRRDRDGCCPGGARALRPAPAPSHRCRRRCGPTPGRSRPAT